MKPTPSGAPMTNPAKHLILLLALLCLTSTAAAGEPIAVIVNKNNPTNDISIAELSSILKGKKLRWNDAQKIVKFNFSSDTTIRRDFYREALNLDPHSKITLPTSDEAYDGIEVASEKAMIALVAATPNAIGYLPSSSVTSEVKILRINGYLPRDPGYQLK